MSQAWRQQRDNYRRPSGSGSSATAAAVAASSALTRSSAGSGTGACAGAAGAGYGAAPAVFAPIGVATAAVVVGVANDGGLCAAAAAGDVARCRQILERGLTGPCVHGSDGTTPLCAAAMWGQADVVRLLLGAAAETGQRSRGGRGATALHVASLQEHGKVCMLLLERRADALASDDSGVTPRDYASCSDAVWPLFAAAGHERASKEDLVNRRVIRRASLTLEADLGSGAEVGGEAASGASGASGSGQGILREFSRPGSAYVLSAHHPPRPGSSAGGPSMGPLGVPVRPGSRAQRPARAPIDILAEDGPATAVADPFGASARRGSSSGSAVLGSLGL